MHKVSLKSVNYLIDQRCFKSNKFSKNEFLEGIFIKAVSINPNFKSRYI